MNTFGGSSQHDKKGIRGIGGKDGCDEGGNENGHHTDYDQEAGKEMASVFYRVPAFLLFFRIGIGNPLEPDGQPLEQGVGNG